MKKYFKTDISRQQKIIMSIVVAIIIAFLGVIIYSWLAPKSSGMQSKLSGASLTGSETVKEETAQDRTQTDNFNKNASEQAIKEGQTFLSVPTGNPEPVNLKPANQSVPAVFAPSTVPVNQVHASYDSRPRYSEQTIKTAEALVKSLQASNVYPLANFAMIHDMADINITASSSSGSLTKPSSLSDAAVKPSVIFPAFKLCPAELNTQLDTDTNSIVTVTLSCSELYHAVIQAPGYKLVGENIDMTFSAMSMNGKPYKITAKAVDLDTGRSMLSGDVDHRYVQRIVLPALALGAAKYGSLYENSTDQSTYVSDGTIVQSSSGKVSNDQVTGAFVGGLGQQTANVLNADASRIPPINVKRDDDKRTIGIMFLEPVLSTDAMDVTAPKSAAEVQSSFDSSPQPAAAAQMQQQQLLQNNAVQLPVTPNPPGVSYTPRPQAY